MGDPGHTIYMDRASGSCMNFCMKAMYVTTADLWYAHVPGGARVVPDLANSRTVINGRSEHTQGWAAGHNVVP